MWPRFTSKSAEGRQCSASLVLTPKGLHFLARNGWCFWWHKSLVSHGLRPRMYACLAAVFILLDSRSKSFRLVVLRQGLVGSDFGEIEALFGPKRGQFGDLSSAHVVGISGFTSKCAPTVKVCRMLVGKGYRSRFGGLIWYSACACGRHVSVPFELQMALPPFVTPDQDRPDAPRGGTKCQIRT